MSNAPVNPSQIQRKIVEKKMRIVSELFDFAFNLKWYQFKNQYPQKTDSEIKKLVLESIERGCKS